MSKKTTHVTRDELFARRQRLAEAMNLHAIEGNPFTEADIAMFEMFEREGWSDDRQRQYVIDLARKKSRPSATE
jgi:hypothetical protein